MEQFIQEVIEPGSRVHTDAWGGYNRLDRLGYQHRVVNLSNTGNPAHVAMPAVHRRCRIAPFVRLARTITYYRADIEATLLHGVNNGRLESLNTKVRLIAPRAFGFHSAKAMIALAELTHGGLCPALPGRQ